jgi:hypothetical protein
MFSGGAPPLNIIRKSRKENLYRSTLRKKEPKTMVKKGKKKR